MVRYYYFRFVFAMLKMCEHGCLYQRLTKILYSSATNNIQSYVTRVFHSHSRQQDSSGKIDMQRKTGSIYNDVNYVNYAPPPPLPMWELTQAASGCVHRVTRHGDKRQPTTSRMHATLPVLKNLSKFSGVWACSAGSWWRGDFAKLSSSSGSPICTNDVPACRNCWMWMNGDAKQVKQLQIYSP